MKALTSALSLMLSLALLSTAALGQTERLHIEDGFAIELPADGLAALDAEASLEDAQVYGWEPNDDSAPIALIQVRIDEFDAPVVDEIYMAYLLGVIETWEEEPENYTVLGAADGIHFGNLAWTALDIEHKDVEPTVFHTSFSMPFADRIYTVLFYYLEPGEAVGEQIGQVMASFEPLRALPATE